MVNPDILNDNAWILPVGIALFVLGFLWQSRKESRLRAARFDSYRTLAAQHGLSFENEAGLKGAKTPLRFSDPGAKLSLRIVPDGQRTKKGPTGSAEFFLQTPAFPGGLAVYAHQEQDELARAASVLSGAFDNPLARGAVGKMLGADIAENLGDLQQFDAPDALPLTILASVDPRDWFDANAIAQAIEDGPRSARRRERRLLIVISSRGMTLRATPVSIEPEGIARFIELGLRLQAVLAKT